MTLMIFTGPSYYSSRLVGLHQKWSKIDVGLFVMLFWDFTHIEKIISFYLPTNRTPVWELSQQLQHQEINSEHELG